MRWEASPTEQISLKLPGSPRKSVEIASLALTCLKCHRNDTRISSSCAGLASMNLDTVVLTSYAGAAGYQLTGIIRFVWCKRL